jgi:SAM-dependent methyltransferase
MRSTVFLPSGKKRLSLTLSRKKSMAETHEILILKPKPKAEEILRLTAEYFDARGRDYDSFEAATPKRDLFTESVDKIIGESFAANPTVSSVLSVACGTGRRELEIQRYSERDLSFTGVEISAEMAELSRSRGFDVIEGSWPDVELPNHNFDSALVLSAFGHVPTQEMRVKFLQRIAQALSPNAPLFFDVLNLNDQNEWGPKLVSLFATESQSENGFDLGDVLYRKIGEPEVCFYHYFTSEEIQSLLSQSGFELTKLWCIGYGDHFGEVMDSGNGAFLVQAKKAG